MQWKVFFASAAGKYHLDGQLPCQDAGHHAAIDDVLIGVVCDGAGSASQGHRGADFFARKVTELIADAVRSGALPKATATPAAIAATAPAATATMAAAAAAAEEERACLLAILGEARGQLAQIAQERQLELRDFACTVVGCITSRRGGCFFHIGDGFAICVRENGQSLLSQPENGEFADETYFVTDERWTEHLRVTPVPEVSPGCLIGLMSDGASPFAVNRARTGFYAPFIDPVMSFLSKANEHNGSQALLNVLEDEKTYSITADDKTLLLALAS
jgi:hypothetical protein